MNSHRRNHTVSGAFVFVLLGLFAVLGAVLVLLCAQAYRSGIVRTQQHNEARVLQSFLRHAVLAEDERGAISVRQLDGNTALCIADNADGSGYETLLYVHDGALRELYAAAGEDFHPERGESICPASALEAQLDGQCLTAHLTDKDGQMNEIVIALYGGEVTP